jgi:hypothetical protein
MNSTKEFVLWPIPVFGFEDGDDTNDGDNNDDANDQQQQDNSDSKEEKEDDEDDDELEGLSAKELKRIAKDRARQAKDAAAQAKKTAEDAAKKEREKLNADQKKDFDLKQSQDENARLRATNSKLALIGAIRDDVRYDWHNPEIVAQQLDPAKVTVDAETGQVEGLKSALSDVAKNHAYLLKKKGQQQDSGNNNNNNNNNQQQNNQQSGLQPGQGGANQGGSMPPQQAELVELMPALRSRM